MDSTVGTLLKRVFSLKYPASINQVHPLTSLLASKRLLPTSSHPLNGILPSLASCHFTLGILLSVLASPHFLLDVPPPPVWRPTPFQYPPTSCLISSSILDILPPSASCPSIFCLVSIPLIDIMPFLIWCYLLAYLTLISFKMFSNLFVLLLLSAWLPKIDLVASFSCLTSYHLLPDVLLPLQLPCNSYSEFSSCQTYNQPLFCFVSFFTSTTGNSARSMKHYFRALVLLSVFPDIHDSRAK